MPPHIRQVPGLASAMEHHPVLEEEDTVLWVVPDRQALADRTVLHPADLITLEVATISAEDLAGQIMTDFTTLEVVAEGLITMDSILPGEAPVDLIAMDSIIPGEAPVDLIAMDSIIPGEAPMDLIAMDSKTVGEVPADLGMEDLMTSTEMAACVNPGDKPTMT